MPNARFLTIVTSTLVLFGSALVVAFSAARSADAWWSPGTAACFLQRLRMRTRLDGCRFSTRRVDVETKNNAFFEPIGTNGRACVTCHQPADGMSISVESIQQALAATSGTDPLIRGHRR